MPTPTRAARGIRLRSKALELMAEAIGSDAYYEGRPRLAILTGTNRTGVGTTLARRDPPSVESFVVVSERYAKAAGIGFWQAAEAMFEPVNADGSPLIETASEADAA